MRLLRLLFGTVGHRRLPACRTRIGGPRIRRSLCRHQARRLPRRLTAMVHHRPDSDNAVAAPEWNSAG
jgi:hypothetical protein